MDNRTIKFRAWENGEMLTMPINTNYGISRFFGVLSDDAKLMQYTCVNDEDGKEVYEGDIVQYSKSRVSVVVWHHEGWNTASLTEGCIESQYAGKQPYEVFLGGGSCVEFDTIAFGNWSGFKVIGNIYQNPELLTL